MSIEHLAKRSKHFAPDFLAPRPLAQAHQKTAALALELECDQQTCLLAEPLWVRCSLVNNTTQTITLSYASRFEHENTIAFEITGPDGERVPQYSLLIDSAGPQPLTVLPGQRLVEMYNLFDEYGINKPGPYQITVRYQSDGRSFDPKTLDLRDDLWKGDLVQPLGKVLITAPTRKQDEAALRVLRADSDDWPARSQMEVVFQYVFHEQTKLREIIDKHGASRYAAYARYFAALSTLEQFETSGDRTFAKPAVSLLDAIDAKSYPRLFQEHCRFHQVYAHAAAGASASKVDDLARTFRAHFPDSPLVPALDQIRNSLLNSDSP